MFRDVKKMKAGKKLLVIPILAAACLFPSSAGGGEKSTVEAAVVKNEEKMLIPGGTAVGVTLESNGILVLGTGNVTGRDRHVYSPAENILREGDIILSAGGIELEDKEALSLAVRDCNDRLDLKVKRKNEVLDVSLTPVKCMEDGSNKIGVWVRDSTQGIGTLTYIDPKNNSFGALGHGVYDADTGELMTVKSGNVVKSNITGVRKSEKGKPGELTGVLDKNEIKGEITENNKCGIYGVLNEQSVEEYYNKPIPIADKSEIRQGDVTILNSSVDGRISEYKAEITSINLNHKDADKGIVLKITDEKLKETAGGIVQGMSGSPIIQDGKLIGAVTHVLVNDPTRGYGIFIENMLEAAG